MMTVLSPAYYQQEDPVLLARSLIGKVLATRIGGEVITAGIITETEAYWAPDDRASHAYNFRRTKRNEAMYHAGGIAYTYICYGIHTLFNVVTGGAEMPHAILIRAVQPVDGIDLILKRRNKNVLDSTISGGPGTLTQALGISIAHNFISLTDKSSPIWIEDRGILPFPDKVRAAPRIGIDYAVEDALLPWRFILT